MKNISFSATIEKFRARRKHVTRRLKWLDLKPGNQLMGCEKVQGIKKGELVRMGPITILEVNREPLAHILRKYYRTIPQAVCDAYIDVSGSVSEMVLEGFPELTPVQFVDMFCEMNDCEPETEVTRILFDYVGRIA